MIDRLHPTTILLYFLLTISLPMSCLHPLMLLASLLGASTLLLTCGNTCITLRSLLGWLLFFILISVINPLLHHNGETVLFYINQNRITLEAFLYGLCSAAMLIGIFLWCKNLSRLMDSQRLLYLFARVSGRFALVLSMILHFVPNYLAQYKKMKLGLSSQNLQQDTTLLGRLRQGRLLFASLLTWSLEHSLVTADSMSARGYGTEKRTNSRRYPYSTVDGILAGLWLVLLVLHLFSRKSGCLTPQFYPSIYVNYSSSAFVGMLSFMGIALSLPCLEFIHFIKMKRCL